MPLELNGPNAAVCRGRFAPVWHHLRGSTCRAHRRQAGSWASASSRFSKAAAVRSSGGTQSGKGMAIVWCRPDAV
jgi:hypothetical protein